MTMFVEFDTGGFLTFFMTSMGTFGTLLLLNVFHALALYVTVKYTDEVQFKPPVSSATIITPRRTPFGSIAATVVSFIAPLRRHDFRLLFITRFMTQSMSTEWEQFVRPGQLTVAYAVVVRSSVTVPLGESSDCQPLVRELLRSKNFFPFSCRMRSFALSSFEVPWSRRRLPKLWQSCSFLCFWARCSRRHCPGLSRMLLAASGKLSCIGPAVLWLPAVSS